MDGSLSASEQNYLKHLFKLGASDREVSTNNLSTSIDAKASSVTDMIQKLSDKGFVYNRKYKGTILTRKGKKQAIAVYRRNKLWELYLIQVFGLEKQEAKSLACHYQSRSSEELELKLDKLLETPSVDADGIPFIDSSGKLRDTQVILLSEVAENIPVKVIGFNDSSEAFMQYLERIDVTLGVDIVVRNIFEFDGSVEIEVNGKVSSVSKQVAKNINVHEN